MGFFFEINLVFYILLASLSLCVSLPGLGRGRYRGGGGKGRVVSFSFSGVESYSLNAMPVFSLWWPLLLWSTDSRARWLGWLWPGA